MEGCKVGELLQRALKELIGSHSAGGGGVQITHWVEGEGLVACMELWVHPQHSLMGMVVPCGIFVHCVKMHCCDWCKKC